MACCAWADACIHSEYETVVLPLGSAIYVGCYQVRQGGELQCAIAWQKMQAAVQQHKAQSGHNPWKNSEPYRKELANLVVTVSGPNWKVPAR